VTAATTCLASAALAARSGGRLASFTM
jgi:hypothetical protein